jgi:hypothetical protein
MPSGADAFGQAPEAGALGGAGVNPAMFGDFMPLPPGGRIVETFPFPAGTTPPPSITGSTNVNTSAGTGVLTITSNSVIFTFPTGVRSLPFALVGATFNVDVILPDGSILPAGQPLTRGRLLNPAVFAGPFTAVTAVGASEIATVARRGAFKITENESPRPQDRVFGTYNFYYDVGGSFNAGTGLPRTDVNRETVGFEKTFLGGNASLGMRLPILQVEGDSSVARSDIGDLSIIGKYALLNDRETGNVLSGGLVLTVPTGASFLPAGIPDIHPFLLQPFVGGICNLGNFYVQGFSSIAVPTDSRDVTLFFNDVALGYFLYRTRDCGRLITLVAPTVEAHLTTPLNHRGSQALPIGSADILDLTFGTTIGLRAHSTLGVGVVTPVTGPRPFDVEAQVYLNYQF